MSEEIANDIINIDNALVDIQDRLSKLETNVDARLSNIETKMSASEAFLEKILGGLAEFKESPIMKMLGGNLGNKKKSTNYVPGIPSGGGVE